MKTISDTECAAMAHARKLTVNILSYKLHKESSVENTDDSFIRMTDTTQLVLNCKRHDQRAQRELYDLYKARLMGVCRRYASGREEAQDILQEVFIKIFTKIAQLDSPERLESWMMRIAVNTAIDYYHQGKKNIFKNIEVVDAESSDYEHLLSGIADKFLIGLINELPDGCRLVFNLFVVEGYSHAEIAVMLNITESTSRSQLVYAKKILKEKLTSVGVLKYERYA
jgi:RNA polymerase sigma-70 factor (ECF subfamily)